MLILFMYHIIQLTKKEKQTTTTTNNISYTQTMYRENKSKSPLQTVTVIIQYKRNYAL